MELQVLTWRFGRSIQTLGLVISCDWMKEGVDEVALESETITH